MKRTLALIPVMALSLFATGVLLAQQENPFAGTWKLNVAKSKFTGRQPPKSETRTEVAQGDGFKVSYEGIAADGSPISYGYTTNLDGKDAPISGKHPFGSDALAVTRVDASRRTIVEKKTGTTLFTATGTVSKDGKTLTQTFKGMNAQGQPFSVTSVWDKQ